MDWEDFWAGFALVAVAVVVILPPVVFMVSAWAIGFILLTVEIFKAAFGGG